MSANPNEGNQYDRPNQEVVGTDVINDDEAQPTDEPDDEETETPETEPETEPETQPVEPEREPEDA